MGAERRGGRAGGGGARHLHVEGHPHDLVVDEGALGAQAVGAAHVAVVGGEDHDGVVPRPRRLEGAQHRAEVLVGQVVEVDVVVEVTEPGGGVRRVDVTHQPVLLVPPPLAVRLRLGVEGVAEVRREPVAHLGVGVAVDGQRLVVLPGRRLQDPADVGDVLGVAVLVAGLVHREPHHVVGVDQRHGQEPRLGPVVGGAGVLGQPVGGVGGDDRVEVDAGAGPAHEVAVVAVPVGEAVRLHVRPGGVGEVPLADVGRAVAGPPEQRTQGRGRRRQFVVLRHDDVVQHPVAR